MTSDHDSEQKGMSRMGSHYTELDLGAAAFLMALGFQFVGLRPLSRSKFGFVFEDCEGRAAEEARRYYSDAPTSARQMAESLRNLKTVMRRQSVTLENRDEHTIRQRHRVPA